MKGTQFVKDFFNQIKNLSQPKLKIYKSFFEMFIENLKPYDQGIIFDGFAGQGVYRDESNQINSDIIDVGSPILAMIAGIEYLNEQKRAHLRFIFIEKEFKSFKILCENIAQCFFHMVDGFTIVTIKSEKKAEFEIVDNNVYFNVQIYCDEFQNQIDLYNFESLEENQKLLSILDPFGYKDLGHESLYKLVGKNKEILVTLMSKWINRHKEIDTHKESILSTLRIKENDLKELINQNDIAFKFGEYLQQFNSNDHNIRPIYMKLRNSKIPYMLIYVAGQSISYNAMFERFSNKSEQDFILYEWRQQPTTNYKVEKICETRERNGKIFYRIKWKGKNRSTTWMHKTKYERKYSDSKMACHFNHRSRSDSNQIYTVEKILDEKISNGKRFYLIKWKNYSDFYNNWEPECHLNCDKLLREFKKNRKTNKIKRLRRNINRSFLNKKKKKKKNEEKIKSEKQTEKTNKSKKLTTNDEYIVEEILDKKIKDGTPYYLVKWENYSHKKNSWEPIENMFCIEMVDDFEKKLSNPNLNDSLQTEKSDLNSESLHESEVEQITSKSNVQKETENIIFEIGNKTVENIIGVTLTDEKEILFLVKFENHNRFRFVRRKDANEKCAQEVIRFYEKHIKFT